MTNDFEYVFPGNALDRRAFIRKGALGVASTAMILSSPGCREGVTMSDRKKRPNLIYIFPDELRYQSTGYAGCRDVKTPAIDKLASESVSFTNAISTTPLCAPYRAAMLTGKYPHTTGVIANEMALPGGTETLATILSREGYRTGYIGKWHLGKMEPSPERPGQFRPEQYISPDKRFGFKYWSAYAFNHMHNTNTYYEDSPEPIHREGFQMDSETDRAIEFIRNPALGRQSQEGHEPFALFLAWGPPHPPFEAWNMPRKYIETYGEVMPMDRASLSDRDAWGWQDWQKPVEFIPQPLSPVRPNGRQRNPDRSVDRYHHTSDAWQDKSIGTYYAMINWVDDCMKRLLDALAESGLADNTIVVFTSDHGEMLGSHGLQGKMTFYDESVRIPMLIRYPGRIPAGTVSDACMGTVDILPTLLGLMNIQPPRDVQGDNLAYQALGCPDAIPEGVLVGNRPAPDHALIASYSGYEEFQTGWEHRGLRTKRYTYARSLVQMRNDYVGWKKGEKYSKEPEVYLFDNEKDPYQMSNLAGTTEYAALQANLERKLVARLKEVKDDFRPASEYKPHYTPNGELIRPLV